jgi:molybdopterin synthase sulfur carrier subunit
MQRRRNCCAPVAAVTFTPHLQRFFPNLGERTIDSPTLRALVKALDAEHPGLAGYLVDDRGRLRTHVMIFVDGRPLADREELADAIGPDTRVYIAQALSGG